MYALVDCNNFYVSCERLFQPRLNGKPVVVLSNNDGCVIARSEEAKMLGIVMGTPAHQYRQLFSRHGVNVFSSNYTLYGDISDRIMQTLLHFSPAIEVYSIDEAFLDLHGHPHSPGDIGARIRKTIKRNIGIRVTVGIASTKTLAKMANRYAKKYLRNEGVFFPGNAELVKQMMLATPVDETWGIGKQHGLLLKKQNCHSAFDLGTMPHEWVRKHMSIVGLRLVNELNGIASTRLEDEAKGKKNICTSRSFGRMTNDLGIISEATSNYAANCAEKLRSQRSVCRAIQVFITTNPHNSNAAQYSASVKLNCAIPTNQTNVLISLALKGLKMLFRPNAFLYMKCGVVAMDIIPESAVQLNLFSPVTSQANNRIATTMDKLNQSMGKNTIRFAVQRFDQRYKLKAERLSKKYTTDINEILKVKI